jgi:hypothetical protein
VAHHQVTAASHSHIVREDRVTRVGVAHHQVTAVSHSHMVREDRVTRVGVAHHQVTADKKPVRVKKVGVFIRVLPPPAYCNSQSASQRACQSERSSRAEQTHTSLVPLFCVNTLKKVLPSKHRTRFL